MECVAGDDHRPPPPLIELPSDCGSYEESGKRRQTDDHPNPKRAGTQVFEVAGKVDEQEEGQAREEADAPREGEAGRDQSGHWSRNIRGSRSGLDRPQIRSREPASRREHSLAKTPREARNLTSVFA